MLRQVPRRYHRVRGLIYFDVNDRGTHWPLETSHRVIRAFRHGIARHAYAPAASATSSPGRSGRWAGQAAGFR